MDNDRLPSIEELGQDFLEGLQNDFGIQDYFLDNSDEIIKRLDRKIVDQFIKQFDEFYDSKEVDEFDLPSYFSSALYCAYTEQEKEPQDFLQDLVTNTFKI